MAHFNLPPGVTLQDLEPTKQPSTEDFFDRLDRAYDQHVDRCLAEGQRLAEERSSSAAIQSAIRTGSGLHLPSPAGQRRVPAPGTAQNRPVALRAQVQRLARAGACSDTNHVQPLWRAAHDPARVLHCTGLALPRSESIPVVWSSGLIVKPWSVVTALAEARSWSSTTSPWAAPSLTTGARPSSSWPCPSTTARSLLLPTRSMPCLHQPKAWSRQLELYHAPPAVEPSVAMSLLRRTGRQANRFASTRSNCARPPWSFPAG